MKKTGNVIAIDPSMRSLGWAQFDNGIPVGWGVIRAKPLHTQHWWTRARQMADATVECLSGCLARSVVVIEMPEKRKDLKGRMSEESEAIQKLYYFVGFLNARLLTTARRVIPVLVHQWKGQLPKALVRARVLTIAKRLKVDIPTNLALDTFEALGIGLWWLKYKEFE